MLKLATEQVQAIHPPLSDKKLLSLCHQYGSQAKLWKQKFLGLLPEVERRQLYLKRGCASVFEFAAKLGGVNKDQVLLVLNLERRFELLPQLQQALVSGDISVHKLTRVASVATPDNQDFWYSQSKLLSKAALETVIKDTKGLPGQTAESSKTQKTTSRAIEKVAQSDELHVSARIRQRLLALQYKGLDLNQVLEELLDQRDEQIQHEKQQLATEPGGSRYIPVKVKQVLTQEYGSKCAQENCSNKSINVHHTRRFGLNSSHNPLYLAPLCKLHHEIAHSIDVRVQVGGVNARQYT